MRDIKPVIQLAKERGLFRFSAIASRMLQDAAISIGKIDRTAAAASEQKALPAARAFLGSEKVTFHRRLCSRYADYVERAMSTMYNDNRPGLLDSSPDSWALIDDDTIVRQIEVDRGVMRLRDADQLSLSRLNLMIAQLHEERDVRERENPFRPYLMARALHDVLAEMTVSADIAAMLFNHLSGALAAQLPEYFAAITEVFEANGVHATLMARPSASTRREREMMLPSSQIAPAYVTSSPQGDGVADASASNGYNTGSTHSDLVNSVPHAGSGGFPSLHNAIATSSALDHVLSVLRQRSHDANTSAPLSRHGEQNEQNELRDFVWKMFKQPSAVQGSSSFPRFSGHSGDSGASGDSGDFADGRSTRPHPLATQLHRLQRAVIPSDPSDDKLGPLDLHTEISTDQLSEMDRLLMDVVVLLFNYIDGEMSIAAPFRAQLARLQIPFLRATLLDPEILQRQDHPFRTLLNRMVSVTQELDPLTSPGKEIVSELTSVVENILHDFTAEMTIFTRMLSRFEAYVEKVLRHTDPEIVRAIAAFDAAEKDPQQQQALVSQTVDALRERLLTVKTDQRAIDFIVTVWAKVLVHVNGRREIDSKPYRELVAELIWSVQEHDRSERSALLTLLTRLVTTVKQGMKMIELPEDESRKSLDDLIAMHAHVLGTMQNVPLQASTSLETLRNHFAYLRIGEAMHEETAEIHLPTVPPERLKAAMRKANVSATMYLDNDVGTLQSSDVKWLAGLENATAIECWIDNAYVPAKLVWVDGQQSFYLFQLGGSSASLSHMQQDPGPHDARPNDEGHAAVVAAEQGHLSRPRLLIYSSISLIKGLREGSIGMIENAPVVDRAIKSLAAESIQPDQS